MLDAAGESSAAESTGLAVVVQAMSLGFGLRAIVAVRTIIPATIPEDTMNRQFLISVVGLFVVTMLLGFVVHGLLLAGDYAQLPNLYRGDQDGQAHFQWMLIAHVFLAIGLTWVYRQGRDAGPWLAQGLRFGLAIAVLTTIPNFLTYFAVQPNPGLLVAKQIVFDTLAMLVMGVAAAALNRQAAA